MQSVESKKEEFQKYLEKAGVVDALTKVLVGLYEAPDRPNNAIDFVRDYLGAPAGVDVDELKAQNEALKKQLEAKDAEIAELQKQVEELKPKA